VFAVLALLHAVSADAKVVLLNEESGLSNAAVLCIAKDARGRMWIGTRSGLNLYDGYTFMPVQKFNGARINTLLYDSTRNAMWIGSTSGLHFIDCETGDITTCTPSDNPNEVIGIMGFGGKLYVGFRKKYLMEIGPDYRCRVIFHYGFSGILAENRITSDPFGTIYLALSRYSHIVRINTVTQKVSRDLYAAVDDIEFLHATDSLVVIGMVRPSVGRSKAGFALPVFLSTRYRNVTQPAGKMPGDKLPYMVLSDNLEFFHAHRHNPSMILMLNKEETVLDNKSGLSLYTDDFNTLWIGTNRGLIICTRDKPLIPFEKLLWDSATRVSTREIIADKAQNLYVGSYNGLFTYDAARKEWSQYRKVIMQRQKTGFIQRSLLLDGPYLYVGSEMERGFTRLDMRTRKLSVDFAMNSKPEYPVLSMGKSADGHLWLGTLYGLAEYDPQTRQVTYHNNDKFGVGNQGVRVIRMIDNGNRFWAGCVMGLYLVDIRKGVVFYADKNTRPALSDNGINVISEDSKGNTWIGTIERGISILAPDLNRIEYITKKDGLSSNEIYSIQWQDSNNVWISTYNGLNHYSLLTRTATSFFIEDGIADNEFNQNSSYKAPDGKLYFGGMNGITSFYPPDMTFARQPYNVYVSSIHKLDVSSGIYKEISGSIRNNEIMLEPGENHLLTFSFAINNCGSSEKATYFYKIGDGENWTNLESLRMLRLESLQPGKYTLYIKAQMGTKGIASANIIQYQLEIKQVFYKTIWFFLLLSSTVIFLIVFYFSIKLRNLKKMNELRVRIASNLHDEVGSLLTRITMAVDYVSDRLKDDTATREELDKVSGLSRAANVAMSDVLWSIDSRNDFAGDLIDRMQEHAEHMLLPKGIDIDMNITDVDYDMQLSPEMRQHLFLIFKEAVHNVSKHSDATYVRITYGKNRLQITNNGIRSKGWKNAFTGQGLQNIQMRAELLGGFANIERTDTEFIVTVFVE
jgi:ligand-binding sensor domain-containing protein/signal transduction histidine kinase